MHVMAVPFDTEWKFQDNPVGTGYSFVEDKEAFVKTDWEAATDLTTLLKKLYNKNKTLQASPLYIVAESYGGKFAVTLGLSVAKAIKAGELKLKFGGIGLLRYLLYPGLPLRNVSFVDKS